MQFYQGPSRRVLRRYKGTVGFTIDGIVDQEEERGLFVKQSFTLEQFRMQGDDNFYNMADTWVFDYENDFVIPEGGRVPFQQDHTITDRLLLNKSFNNVAFHPANCNNILQIDTKSQTRLAPLLCAHTTYSNVTRPPVITTDIAGQVQPTVDVQMGDYNRFWFGAVEDMGDHAGVTNRRGLAPYTVADVGNPVTQGAGDHPQIGDGLGPGQAAVGNREIYTAYGFEPAKIPTGQELRHFEQNTMLGERDAVRGIVSGAITWIYNEASDNYESTPFDVDIPFPLNQVGDNITIGRFTVPQMATRSVSESIPFNYFFTGDVAENPRNSVPALGSINVVAAPAHINETYNTYDFVRVKLGNTNNSFVGDTTERTIYLFVPAFRIVKGNQYRSIARPRRYAASSATTALQAWLPNNATPMSALVSPGGTDLPSQVPFWANYQNLRGELQHKNLLVGAHPVEQKLFDYVKVGHLGLDDTPPAVVAAALANVITQQGLIGQAQALLDGLHAVDDADYIATQQEIIDENTILIHGLNPVNDSEEIMQLQLDVHAARVALLGLVVGVDNAAIAAQNLIITNAHARMAGPGFANIAIQQAIIDAAQGIIDGPPALQVPGDNAAIAVQQGIIAAAHAIMDPIVVIVQPLQAAIAAAHAIIHGLTAGGNAGLIAAQNLIIQNATAARGVSQLVIDGYPGTDTDPMFILQIMPQADLPAAFQTQLAVFATMAVANRGVNAIQAADKEVMFLYKRTGTDYYGYFRVQLDELNTFRAANGNFNANRFGNKIGANQHGVFRTALWAKRQFQIELLTARNGKYLKENMSPFRSENARELGFRIADANQRTTAIDLANITSETFEAAKPFDFRSTYNFMNKDYTFGAQANRPALTLPQRENDGTLNAANLAFYENNEFELFLPVQREVPNTLVRPHTVTVDCCEPFFGYCSGSSQLECQHPMDTRRLGKNYPIIMQDMSYTYQRAADMLFTRGYKSDVNTTLVIKNTSEPQFTAISEKLPGVHQQDKELMRIAEVTPTFDAFKTTFTDHPDAIYLKLPTIPTIEIETRSGMFEYLFMWLEYPSQPIDVFFPYSDPVIQSLQFKVRGRENQFVRQLDGDDLERLSRANCHKLCNWRDWHESGQGILLSLADIGLTEEIAFPERKRIQMEISCLTRKDPEKALAGSIHVDLPMILEFNVVIIRRNQLFKGDFTGTRFVFLNENK